MLRLRSIQVGLSLVFGLFLLVMVLLGGFSIGQLRAVNHASVLVRSHWLPSTQALGDLNNYTSDARAAEASRLLVETPQQLSALLTEMTELDRQIAKAAADYRHLEHEESERTLFATFVADWDAYVACAHQVFALQDAGDFQGARALYLNRSRQLYDRASDDLGLLTAKTSDRARSASLQSQIAYSSARSLIYDVILFTGLGAALAILYLRSNVTEPLLSLSRVMRALAAGEIKVEIEGAGRRDEIGEMARSVEVFRANAVELAQSREGLAQQAAMLSEKLDAERRLTTNQRNFISMASHEFRTPLMILDGQAQRIIAKRAGLTPEDLMDRMAKIRTAVLRIDHMIDEILETSRLTDTDPSLYFHAAPTDLLQILSDLCQTHRQLHPAMDIVLRGGLEGQLVNLDPKLCAQALGNLISNAIKYSTGGRRIEVSLACAATEAVVCVQDFGMGVAAQDKERIFERYHRGANVAGITGAGLGLYLAKLVADLHKGRTWVESEEGEGARFFFVLPLS